MKCLYVHKKTLNGIPYRQGKTESGDDVFEVPQVNISDGFHLRPDISFSLTGVKKRVFAVLDVINFLPDETKSNITFEFITLNS